MSYSGDSNALPTVASCSALAGRSVSRLSREGVKRRHSRERSSSSSASPVGQRSRCSGRRRRSPTHLHAQSPTGHGTASGPSLRFVLDELAVLRGEIAKLSANPPKSEEEVNFQATASTRQPSPANFSGFVAESSEEGEITETTPRGSVLLQNAKDLGPPDTVSVDIDDQVAGMVNFLFDNGLQDEDYKAISENCNPQILEALKTDARKADARLKDVCGDILNVGTILTKSLLALDQIAQESAHPVVEREVNNINGALALLGHANHKNNLARRQIEESEKLRHKLAAKKTIPVPWRFTSGRSRGFWGRTTHRTYSPRFQPYGLVRGVRSGQWQQQPRPDQESKNARGRGHFRPQR
ncbi:hypothetical protein E2C01_063777 [Portunus trituberculatus]|uniref:Uncharacterized protein n=1 Tax=Portunus trituberculatus TaxID=210409 RepID=A0A5B7HIK3_PORTR|nr:hypothetical protein [Portunus trituberculatus]